MGKKVELVKLSVNARIYLKEIIKRVQISEDRKTEVGDYPRGSGTLFAVRNVSLVWVVGVAQQGARGCHATAAGRIGLARLGTAFLFVLIICCGGLAPFRVTH